MQRNIRTRAHIVRVIRDEMEREGFVDIETPILWKPTPEGARDFVVPSRLQPGHFFALPQSPQIAKQLLVISGFERYYQIARCFRDEDLRADRLQELTQLDVEMAFPDQDFLFGADGADRRAHLARDDRRRAEAAVPAHAVRRGDAPLRHRPARPALRHGDPGGDRGHARLGVRRVRERARRCATSRCRRSTRARELQALENHARSWGAKGLAYIVFRADGELSLADRQVPLATTCSTAGAEPGHTLLFVADEPRIVAKVLGLLRLQLGRELELIDESKWEFLWIVDMAAAEFIEETGTWQAAHHPFTRPTAETLDLFATDPGAARAVAYDLVGNGIELAGGSFRIHEPELQQQVFEYLGIGPEEQEEKFGFLLEALSDGRAAARRHRVGHRPPDDGAPQRAAHPRHARRSRRTRRGLI